MNLLMKKNRIFNLQNNPKAPCILLQTDTFRSSEKQVSIDFLVELSQRAAGIPRLSFHFRTT